MWLNVFYFVEFVLVLTLEQNNQSYLERLIDFVTMTILVFFLSDLFFPFSSICVCLAVMVDVLLKLILF